MNKFELSLKELEPLFKALREINNVEEPTNEN
jgi:hypothetical protein